MKVIAGIQGGKIPGYIDFNKVRQEYFTIELQTSCIRLLFNENWALRSGQSICFFFNDEINDNAEESCKKAPNTWETFVKKNKAYQ